MRVDSCIVDIHQGGKSVYDDGFIGGMDAEPIEVILSKQCGTVQVQILDDRKQPVPNAFVSLVPGRGTSAESAALQALHI